MSWIENWTSEATGSFDMRTTAIFTSKANGPGNG